MENMKEKVWGLYTTYNPESVEKSDEATMWINIDELSKAIFWAHHDTFTPWGAKVPMDQIMEAEYNLEYLIYSTRRFGVEFGREPSATERVERSESYNAWFKFWKDHFSSMTDDIYSLFIDDKCSGKDISIYMPTGSWKDSLEKQPQKSLADHL